MKIKGSKAFLAPGLIILTVMIVMLSSRIRAISGDEVITYSMANSDYGFVFSNGRVGKYFDEHIRDESLVKTLGNIIGTALDTSAFFGSEPPKESGWYNDRFFDRVFTTEEGEYFNFIKVTANACSDESNPFLYYIVMNFVCSCLGFLKGSIWTGIIVNLASVAGAYWIFCLILQELGFRRDLAAVLALFPCCGRQALEQAVNIRAYVFIFMLSALLCLLHLKLLKSLFSGPGAGQAHAPLPVAGQAHSPSPAASDRSGKYIRYIIAIYLIGYFSHYIVAIFAFFLYVSCIAYGIRKKCEPGAIRKYGVDLAATVVVGVAVYPIPVFGLLKKLKSQMGGERPSLISLVGSDLKIFMDETFVSPWFFFLVLGLLLFGAVKTFRNRRVSGDGVTGNNPKESRDARREFPVDGRWLLLLISGILFDVVLIPIGIGRYGLIGRSLAAFSLMGIAASLNFNSHGSEIGNKVPEAPGTPGASGAPGTLGASGAPEALGNPKKSTPPGVGLSIILLTAFALLFCSISFARQYAAIENHQQGLFAEEKFKAADSLQDMPSIYLRARKSHFENVQYLRKAGDTLVITAPEVSPIEFENDPRLTELKEAAVFIDNEDAGSINLFEELMRKAGFTECEPIYGSSPYDGGLRILRYSK